MTSWDISSTALAAAALLGQLTGLIALLVLGGRQLLLKPAQGYISVNSAPPTNAILLDSEGQMIEVPPNMPLGGFNPATPLSAAIPLAAEVVDYCNEESEDFARDACKARARGHYADSANWDLVLIQLQKDDGE